MQDPEDLIGRYRERGLKVTPQRSAVFRALYGNHTHPTAEAVHAAVVAEMPTVSLRTVYQVLNDLAEMGEILHLDVGTGSARFDPNVEDLHHHLVCQGCGMVRDLHLDLHLDLDPLGVSHLPEGFEVSGEELVVRGLCAGCRGRAVDAATDTPAHAAPAAT